MYVKCENTHECVHEYAYTYRPFDHQIINLNSNFEHLTGLYTLYRLYFIKNYNHFWQLKTKRTLSTPHSSRFWVYGCSGGYGAQCTGRCDVGPRLGESLGNAARWGTGGLIVDFIFIYLFYIIIFLKNDLHNTLSRMEMKMLSGNRIQSQMLRLRQVSLSPVGS